MNERATARLTSERTYTHAKMGEEITGVAAYTPILPYKRNNHKNAIMNVISMKLATHTYIQCQ